MCCMFRRTPSTAFAPSSLYIPPFCRSTSNTQLVQLNHCPSVCVQCVICCFRLLSNKSNSRCAAVFISDFHVCFVYNFAYCFVHTIWICFWRRWNFSTSISFASTEQTHTRVRGYQPLTNMTKRNELVFFGEKLIIQLKCRNVVLRAVAIYR